MLHSVSMSLLSSSSGNDKTQLIAQYHKVQKFSFSISPIVVSNLCMLQPLSVMKMSYKSTVVTHSIYLHYENRSYLNKYRFRYISTATQCLHWPKEPAGHEQLHLILQLLFSLIILKFTSCGMSLRAEDFKHNAKNCFSFK